MKNIGIILAGGIGTRFGKDRPKQYTVINEKELIAYSIDAFKNANLIDEIVVVLNKEEYLSKRIEKLYNVVCIQGGNTRNQSFKNALDYINDNYPDCENIIENNAACPMITSSLIDEYIELLKEYDCVTTAYHIKDALGSFDGKYYKRENFYLIQSPDAYRFKLLYQYYDEKSELIHPAQMLPETKKEYLYFGFPNNVKVTNPEDELLISFLLKNK